MTFDLYLTIGGVILIFAVPSLMSAFSQGRAPRAAAIMVLIGGGLVTWAVTQKPEGYVLSDIPDAFVRVVGHYVR